MNFIINNQKNSQTYSHIYIYTILLQVINTIFIEQMPTYLIFRKGHFMLASKFSTVYHAVRQSLRIKKAKFKAALRKDLNTHSFYPVDEFFMCKDDL